MSEVCQGYRDYRNHLLEAENSMVKIVDVLAATSSNRELTPEAR